MKPITSLLTLLTTTALMVMACKQTDRPDVAPTRVPDKTAASNPKPVAPPDTPKPPPLPPSQPLGQNWHFETDTPGSPPDGFAFGLTGRGKRGRWEIKADEGGQVLAQLDADSTNFRFPVAVVKTPQGADVRVSVRCKMLTGKVDRACGLVARYADEHNYYITRANVLEDNIRLYTVKAGKRKQLASWSGKVTDGAWHDYRLELRGDQIQVFWDGEKVIDHRDATFDTGGQIGVWTKADSVTYFDDLKVEPLK